MDVFLFFPLLVFAIALVGVMPSTAWTHRQRVAHLALIFIIGFFAWPTWAGSSAARRCR
jgi:ABC-type dipeptide/oligopeptide/nickel transport system permease subunit